LANSRQYKPTFGIIKQVTVSAERCGLDFVLSMVKPPGFGGKSEVRDHNLVSFTLMAAPAAVATQVKRF